MKKHFFILFLFSLCFSAEAQTNYTAKLGLKLTNIPYLGIEYNEAKWGFEGAISSISDDLGLPSQDPDEIFGVSYNRRLFETNLAAKYYIPNEVRDFLGFGSYIGAVIRVGTQISIDDDYFSDYAFNYGVDLEDRHTTTVGIGPTMGYKHHIKDGFGVDFGGTGIIRPIVIGLNHDVNNITVNYHFRVTYTFPNPSPINLMDNNDLDQIEEEEEEEVRERNPRKKKKRKKKKRKKKKRR